MTQAELDRYLQSHGWVPHNGHGSHINYRHPIAPKVLTIRRNGRNYRVPDAIISDFQRKTGLNLKGKI
jgi:predicted RNA binding protein YcfA (HicA-like mRNA interferase family)